MYRLAADYNVQAGGHRAPGLSGCAGLGGCGCGGTCGGLGLFETGTDFTGWGYPEWIIVGMGVYMVASTLFTTSRAVSKVRAIPGERRKRKAAKYRAMANELTKKK